MFGMRSPGSSLLTPAPPGPGQDADHIAAKRKQESAQQATHFRHGQGNGQGSSLLGLFCRGRDSLLCTDDCQDRQNEQNERDMANPPPKPPPFILLSPTIFSIL